MSEEQVNQSSPRNILAIIGLILGILSILSVGLCCCVLPFTYTVPIANNIGGIVMGIAALVMGIIARKQIKTTGGPASQEKLANAALILGIIGTVLGLLGILMAVIVNLTILGPQINELFEDLLQQIQQP